MIHSYSCFVLGRINPMTECIKSVDDSSVHGIDRPIYESELYNAFIRSYQLFTSVIIVIFTGAM